MVNGGGGDRYTAGPMANLLRRCPVVGAVMAMLAASGAMAQSEGAGAAPPSAPESAPPSAPPEPESGARTISEGQQFSFTLIGAGDLMFKTDLDDSPGELSVWRAGAGLEVGVPIGERARLAMLFFGERSWYDFSNATGLVPGTDDPLDETYRIVLRPLLSYQIDEQWGVFGAASLSWGAEDGAELGDAFTVAAFAGVRYAFSKDFSMSLGGGAATQLEDSTEFIPIIGVDWQINERTRLSTTGVEGLGARLTHGFADHWALVVQGSYESRQFRLADDNALSEGAMRDRRLPLGVGITWAPSKTVAVELMGGVVAWEQLRFDDSNGDDVSEVNADPSPFVRVMVRVEF